MSQATGIPNTRFFSGTYDEVYALLCRARDYLAGPARLEFRQLETEGSLDFSLESMRLTSRLVRLMAWLLAQRAVVAGEMTLEDALDEGFRLGDVAVGETRPREGIRLPKRLADMLEQSDRLYRRVARLDEMMRREHRQAA